ncbi:MAG: phosphonate transport system permease protein [Epulopiscium sp.]|jgi:phosphonate transport system permease protein|nr:phosphonate transport system permease protein [Candidatus Epulonipiscium sp.]MDK2822848.1 phosphonate transport system permease protein [Clostridia bacterium]MDN5322834.1 phosphonate transport system permease protein [Clostridia bacterium]
MELNESLKSLWAEFQRQEQSAVSKKLKIRKANKASIVMNITLVSLALLTIYGFFTFDYKGVNILEAVIATITNLKPMFLEPRFNHFGLGKGLYQVVVTLGLTFLTTLIGGTIALFLGLLAAQNLSSKNVSNLIKGFVAFVRAVPTVLWVLIFAVAAGLGSVAAVIGMTFHTVGYLIKAYSESFEELDEGVIEALKASGANWWQIVFQAVIPSSVTYLLSWTFMRFEINYMNAVAMGAAAGAGGIGYELFMASGYYFDLREVGLITYFILAIAIMLEYISIKLKIKVL